MNVTRSTSNNENDTSTNEDRFAKFLVQVYQRPQEVHDLKNFIITDKREFCPVSPKPEVGEMEDFLHLLQQHKEIKDPEFIYSVEYIINYDMIFCNLKNVDNHYKTPLLWRNDAAAKPLSQNMAFETSGKPKELLGKRY